MGTKVLSVMIYDALNAKGAGLGDASIGIIEKAIDEFNAAQQSVQADGSMWLADYPCPLCGTKRGGICHHDF